LENRLVEIEKADEQLQFDSPALSAVEMAQAQQNSKIQPEILDTSGSFKSFASAKKAMQELDEH